MIKFKAVKGWNGSYLVIEIEGGDPADNIGDQVWISPTENTMEIYECADEDVIEELIMLFEHSDRRAVKGVLRRMGILV